MTDKPRSRDQEREAVQALIASICATGATVESYGGNCPVQIEGTLPSPDGETEYYFRARGRHWAIYIGPGAQVLRESSLFRREAYQPEGLTEEQLRFAAGWMDEDVALGFVKQSIEDWTRQQR